MKRPNIIIIYTDQQRWDTLAANGNNIIITPNLNKLAEDGVNFNCCISQNPVCMPSRISAMTGQYCSALNISHMAVTVPEETPTLQKILKNYGYYNGLIGKLHYLPHSNRDHREIHPSYDFDHLELSDEPGCYEDVYRAWVRAKAPQELDKISVGLPPVTEQWQKIMNFNDAIKHNDREINAGIPIECSDATTFSAFVGEQTVEFLRNHKDQSFFCFSGFYSPHSPWMVPQKYLDMYSLEELPIPKYPNDLEIKRKKDSSFSDEELRSVTRGYYAMITEVDYWIGEIIEELKRLNIYDNTIIVFTSDHGEWLGEHLRYGKGHWAPDVVSRVPLVVKVPEKLDGATGLNISNIVECVDIVPTLLELAGIPIPSYVQGDKLPVTKKDEGICKGDGLGLCEYYGWK